MSFCVHTLEYENDMNTVAFSPSGQQVVTGDFDGHIRIWRASGEPLVTFDTEDQVLCVVFSGGDRVAAGLADGAIQVWGLDTGACLLTLIGHEDAVNAVAVSPRDNKLASASGDTTLRIWCAVTGASLHVLREHSEPVWSVTYSPDGCRLVSGSHDRTVKVWSSAGACLATFYLDGDCYSAAFSPDGRIIAATSDNEVRLLDSGTGVIVRDMPCAGNRISTLAFVSNRKLLATGSLDGSVGLWDMSSGACLVTLARHSRKVWAIASSPCGKMLATASFDGTTKLWDISTLLPEARVLVLVLIGRRRLLPHIPQELWHMVVNEFVD